MCTFFYDQDFLNSKHNHVLYLQWNILSYSNQFYSVWFMKNNKSVKILWNFLLKFSNFVWQMVVLLVDHSSQSKQCTVLLTLSCCTSYSSLTNMVHPLITNSLWGLAVHTRDLNLSYHPSCLYLSCVNSLFLWGDN